MLQMILCFNYILDIQDSLIRALLFEGNLLSKAMTALNLRMQFTYVDFQAAMGAFLLKLLKRLRTAETCINSQ